MPSTPHHHYQAFRKFIPWSTVGSIRSTPLTTSTSKPILAKLQLNDAAFLFISRNLSSPGVPGFRWVSGPASLEIIQERLRREFEMDIIATYPSVVYQVTMTDGKVEEIDNPAHLPATNHIETIEEPMVKSFIICPNDYIGDMMALVAEKRGLLVHT